METPTFIDVRHAMEDILKLNPSSPLENRGMSLPRSLGLAEHEPFLEAKARKGGTETRLNFQSQPQLDDEFIIHSHNFRFHLLVVDLLLVVDRFVQTRHTSPSVTKARS